MLATLVNLSSPIGLLGSGGPDAGTQRVLGQDGRKKIKRHGTIKCKC
jgi:hypothetical protein